MQCMLKLSLSKFITFGWKTQLEWNHAFPWLKNPAFQGLMRVGYINLLMVYFYQPLVGEVPWQRKLSTGILQKGFKMEHIHDKFGFYNVHDSCFLVMQLRNRKVQGKPTIDNLNQWQPSSIITQARTNTRTIIGCSTNNVFKEVKVLLHNSCEACFWLAMGCHSVQHMRISSYFTLCIAYGSWRLWIGKQQIKEPLSRMRLISHLS